VFQRPQLTLLERRGGGIKNAVLLQPQVGGRKEVVATGSYDWGGGGYTVTRSWEKGALVGRLC